MSKLAVVIPVFNQWSLTEACLRSLAEHTPGTFYEVLVVDNASTDETSSQCASLLAQLFGERGQYLPQERNVNFGPACNAGAEASRAEFVLFLNNDTVLAPGWLPPLFKAMAGDGRLGAVSPLLVYPDTGRVQHAGVVFDPNLHPVHLFHGFPMSHPAVRRPRTLQAVSAAALFMARSLFLDCGGFHEGFRNGSEDLDLCCTLGRRGLRVGCEPESVIEHHTSRTAGRFDHVGHNARLLNERCRGAFTTDLHRYVRREGFELRLTQWLEPYVASPALPEASRDSLVEQLERDPLWEGGYRALVEEMERGGKLAEALDWQELAAGFFPAMHHFERAANLAGACGEEGRQNHWLARMARVRELLEDDEALISRARENRDWFAGQGEESLAALYRGWLQSRR